MYGLTGASLNVNTACSAFSVAAHLASAAVRLAEAPAAACCGAHLVVTASTQANCARAGMLAPDGRCKTLDAAADGYARADCVGVLLLAGPELAAGPGVARLALAGSAVNQDGRSSSLTAPSGPAQQVVYLVCFSLRFFVVGKSQRLPLFSSD